MWHWLTHLFNHGKHVHKTVHHASKHIVPTLGQVASVASVVGGVNSGISLYERLRTKSETNNNEQNANEQNTNGEDGTLLNDFLLHIETLDKTIQACNSEIRFLKERHSALSNDIQTLQNRNSHFDNLTRGHADQLLKNAIELNNASKEIEILTKENKNTISNLQKARKSIKGLTVFSISLLILIAVLVYYWYNYQPY